MNGARLALVPVSDAPCCWCGVLGGHSERCVYYYPPFEEDKPRRQPSSLESFNKAQREGTTVGHEWSRSQVATGGGPR